MLWWQYTYTLLLCWACTSIIHVHSAPVPYSDSSESGITHKLTTRAGNQALARGLVTPEDVILSKSSTITKKSLPPDSGAQVQINAGEVPDLPIKPVDNECPCQPERDILKLPWKELTTQERIYVVMLYLLFGLGIILLIMFFCVLLAECCECCGYGGTSLGRSGDATDTTWLFASTTAALGDNGRHHHHGSGGYGSRSGSYSGGHSASHSGHHHTSFGHHG